MRVEVREREIRGKEMRRACEKEGGRWGGAGAR